MRWVSIPTEFFLTQITNFRKLRKLTLYLGFSNIWSLAFGIMLIVSLRTPQEGLSVFTGRHV